MPALHCPNCDNDLDIEGHFCPICGHDLRRDAVKQPNNEATTEPAPAMTPPSETVISARTARQSFWSQLEEAADWNAIFLFMAFAFLLFTFLA